MLHILKEWDVVQVRFFERLQITKESFSEPLMGTVPIKGDKTDQKGCSLKDLAHDIQHYLDGFQSQTERINVQ